MKWTKTCTVMLALLSLLLATTSFAATPQMSTNLYRGSNLIGATVENAQGENLGEIKDVVIDNTGRMEYAVLSFGGFMGLGEKYFAVPWAALKPQAGQQPGDTERYVLNIDKERLKNAPGFDKNNWPNMTDRSWAEQIHAFYGVTPPREQREARMYEPATPATVQSVDQSAKLIKIKTSNNEVIELRASEGLLNTLQTGDRVEMVIRKHEMAQPPAAVSPKQ